MSGLSGAVLWDFDGTLVDSERIWVEVETGLARDLGGELPANYHEHTLGGRVADTAAYILAETGSDRPVDWVIDQLWSRTMDVLAAAPIRWMPGVEALVAGLHAAGVPQAVVTSGHRHYLDVTLRRLDPSPFAAEIAGDEVSRNKPDPEPYLVGARALGLAPADCVAVEDSQPGVDAARAAGCAVIAVPTDGMVAPDAGIVEVPTLDGVGPDAFAELVAAARAARETAAS